MDLCEIIFRLSMCHQMVHCFPFMVLFTTHQSYGFTVKPCSFTRKLVRFCQNSKAACSVPYKALLSSVCITGCPCSWVKNCSYVASTFINNSAISPFQLHMYQFIHISLHECSRDVTCHNMSFLHGVNQTCQKQGFNADSGRAGFLLGFI